MYYYVNWQAMLTEILSIYMYKLIRYDAQMISLLTYN